MEPELIAPSATTSRRMSSGTAAVARPRPSACRDTRSGASSTAVSPGAPCRAPSLPESVPHQRRSRRRRAHSPARHGQRRCTPLAHSSHAACGRRCWRSARRRSPAWTRSRASTTLRGRLARLRERGLADERPHRLAALGGRPQRRYFPTAAGVAALGDTTPDDVPHLYPVSRQWFRLLSERLNAVALIYRVAALIAEADPDKEPQRVE